VNDDDLTELLKSWPLEPGRINAREIAGDDGARKIQVRVELGVLQMESEGRPDGQRPQGFDTLLDCQRHRRQQYRRQVGTDVGFVLNADDCRALREEVVQYYRRYVALFSLGDFVGVIRDTDHNQEIFDLCHRYGETDEDRSVLEQLRPSVIMMRARAQAEIAIGGRQPKDALAALDRGLEELRLVYEHAGRGNQFEQSNEVQLLRGMRDALVPKLPSSQRVELQERLQAALDAENYELAAILRDELRLL
jgi:hypothetical protein